MRAPLPLFVGLAHAAATTQANTVAPVVSGTSKIGDTLTTTNGTWSGSPAPSFAYQWQRAGVNIASATASTYVQVAADIGNAIRCVVTATNAAGAASANSNALTFGDAQLYALYARSYDANTDAATPISSQADSSGSSTLTQATGAKQPAWAATHASFNSQPVITDASGATGTVLRGATAADFTFANAGTGVTITAVIRATAATAWLCDNNGGSSTARGFYLISSSSSGNLRYVIGNGATNVIDVSAAMVLNTAYKFHVTHLTGDTGADCHIWRNGSAMTATAGSFNNTNAPSASAPAQVFALGNYSNAAPTNAWQGQIAFLGVASSVFPTATRQTVDAYIAFRWGIAG